MGNVQYLPEEKCIYEQLIAIADANRCAQYADESLDLFKCKIDEKSLRGLSLLLPKCPRLKTVLLDSINEQLVNCLEPYITGLVFKRDVFDIDVCQPLLQRLEFLACDGQSINIDMVNRILKECPNLRNLNICRCPVTYHEMLHVLPFTTCKITCDYDIEPHWDFVLQTAAFVQFMYEKRLYDDGDHAIRYRVLCMLTKKNA